jgi:hypothetical protein
MPASVERKKVRQILQPSSNIIISSFDNVFTKPFCYWEAERKLTPELKCHPSLNACGIGQTCLDDGTTVCCSWGDESDQTNAYAYVGCFPDQGNPRALDDFPGNGYNITTCIAECFEREYEYAGLQWFGECWCGNEPGRVGLPVGDEECWTECAMGHVGRCGGSWRNSVYKTTPNVCHDQSEPLRCDDTDACTTDTFHPLSGCINEPIDPTGLGCEIDQTCFDYDSTPRCSWCETPPHDPSYAYLGCFPDQGHPRAMDDFPGNGYNITTCIAECFDRGYEYCGLQWFGECWCGNEPDRVGIAVGDDECNTECRIGGRGMCGGSWRNSVYLTTPNVGPVVA